MGRLRVILAASAAETEELSNATGLKWLRPHEERYDKCASATHVTFAEAERPTRATQMRDMAATVCLSPLSDSDEVNVSMSRLLSLRILT